MSYDRMAAAYWGRFKQGNRMKRQKRRNNKKWIWQNFFTPDLCDNVLFASFHVTTFTSFYCAETIEWFCFFKDMNVKG